jgi:hypothetical protein
MTRLQNRNGHARVASNSHTLTREEGRKNLESYKNIEGLPVGDAPDGFVDKCSPVEKSVEDTP